jgi:hypothetical protein
LELKLGTVLIRFVDKEWTGRRYGLEREGKKEIF